MSQNLQLQRFSNWSLYFPPPSASHPFISSVDVREGGLVSIVLCLMNRVFQLRGAETLKQLSSGTSHWLARCGTPRNWFRPFANTPDFFCGDGALTMCLKVSSCSVSRTVRPVSLFLWRATHSLPPWSFQRVALVSIFSFFLGHMVKAPSAQKGTGVFAKYLNLAHGVSHRANQWLAPPEKG